MKKYVFKYIKINKIGAMLKSFFFAGHVILNKDPTVWLDGPTHVSSYSFPGNIPAGPHSIPTRKSMFASIYKLGKLICPIFQILWED